MAGNNCSTFRYSNIFFYKSIISELSPSNNNTSFSIVSGFKIYDTINCIALDVSGILFKIYS